MPDRPPLSSFDGTDDRPPLSSFHSTPQEKPAPQMLDEAVAQKRQEAVSGFKRGIAGGLGLPGDVTEFIGRGIGSTTGRALPTSEEITQGMEKLGIERPKGKSDKVIEFLSNPLSYLGGGGILSKVLGAGGAGIGADVGEKVGGTPGEIIGSIAGGSLAGLKSGKPLAIGMETPANRQTAANYLKSEGIEIGAGQQTGSKALQRAEGQLGTAPLSGGVAEEKFDAQMRQFTRAALKRVGETADEATPEVVDRAYSRIGKEFDRLQSNTLIPDQQLATEIGVARQNYINATSAHSRIEHIPDIGNRIAAYAHKGLPMDGKTYKSARSELDRIRRGTHDPVVKEVTGEYIDALDGAMERTLKMTKPQDVGKWAEVRRQYRNMLVIEKAVTGAGETKAQGLITPQSLRGAATQQSRRSYARGKGDFHDLARAGELLMTPPKSSGTAENIRSITLPGMAAGLGGRVLHSDFVQNLLKNRRQTPFALPQKDFAIRALINALGDRNAQNP